MFVLVFTLSYLFSFSGNTSELQKSLPKKHTKTQLIELNRDVASINTDHSKLIAQLSLDEKIGQLFIFGFNGSNFNEVSHSHIKKNKPGSFIFFKRNITSLVETKALIKKMNHFYSSTINSPLFFLDQEGGPVNRLLNTLYFPSPMSISKLQDPVLLEKYSMLKGKLLSDLGFNVNLSPVVDLSSSKSKSFIGERSLGHTANDVSNNVVPYINGLSQSNVLSCLKHYPGHGITESDSHKELVTRNISKEELIINDWSPYKKVSKFSNNMFVMTSHLSVPSIDRNPATYSKKLIDILKSDLKFKGIIITDDIEMAGSGFANNFESKIIDTFLSGHHMILIGWSKSKQSRAITAVKEAILSGKLSKTWLNDTVAKIHQVKMTQQKTRALSSTLTENKSLLNDLKRVSAKVVTDHIKVNSKLNLQTKNVTVLSSSNSFLSQVTKGKPSYKQIKLSKSNYNSELISDLKYKAKIGHKFIFHVTGKWTARLLTHLPDVVKKNTYIISSIDSGWIEKRDQYKYVLDIYTNHPHIGYYISQKIKY